MKTKHATPMYQGNKPYVRVERLPDYPDRGCKLHPLCLKCPRIRCIEDEPLAVRIAAGMDLRR